MRALFVDAEQEWKSKGHRSGLHVIIIDEIDAVTRSRGSLQDATGVRDSVVLEYVCYSALQRCCSGVAVVLQCVPVSRSRGSLQDATGVRDSVVFEYVCCSGVAVCCSSVAVCCSVAPGRDGCA